jgi:hypothetical protein
MSDNREKNSKKHYMPDHFEKVSVYIFKGEKTHVINSDYLNNEEHVGMVAYLDEAPRIGVHRIAIVQCDGRWFSPIDTHIEYKLDDSFKVCDINYIRTPHPVSPTCAWDEEGKKVYVCYISLFSNSWKSRAPRPSTTETAPRDENLYDGDRLGSSPTSTQISHNFDYFMFGVLVEETWNNMVVEAPNMSRELPFAIFQHAMVEYLNAYLLRMHKFDNGDSLLDFVHQDLLLAIDSGKYKIPIPIYEYCKDGSQVRNDV